jgi:ERCC4-type nuclease
MKIIIDNRENELIEKVKKLIDTNPCFKDLEIVVENLPLGDIIISNGKDDILIIERKSIRDLAASIKDGRYDEQSYRLNGIAHENHNIIYLIEGDINHFKNIKMDKMTIYSAIFSLNYFKGFSVMRTFSVEETAFFICNTTKKLIKEENEKKKGYYSKENIINQDKALVVEENNYINVIKKVKKENITPNNIGEIMLCQIPGISTTAALTIMKKYTKIQDLILALQTDENCLKDISYLNNNGQQRKINKSSGEIIIKFLIRPSCE